MKYTRYGKFTYAIGANAQAARVSGIDVERHLVKVYVIAAMLAALAGMVVAARGQTAQATGSNSTALRQLAQATQLFSARQATPHMPRRLMPQSSAQGHTGRAGRFNRHQC